MRAVGAVRNNDQMALSDIHHKKITNIIDCAILNRIAKEVVEDVHYIAPDVNEFTFELRRGVRLDIQPVSPGTSPAKPQVGCRGVTMLERLWVRSYAWQRHLRAPAAE